MKTWFNSLFFTLLFAGIAGLMSGCGNEDEGKKEPEPQGQPDPIACLYDNAITISDINGIPENVTFDKVKAEISGFEWQVIGTIEANYKDGSAIMVLPSSFSSDKLQPADRSDKSKYGYWPGTADNKDALVAALNDFFAYDGTKKVGRIFLSDWNRKGSSAGKAFIYYHYADRDYKLSGSDKSFIYNASFTKGWNAYANIRPISEDVTGGNRCTTAIPETDLQWQFESYVY